MHALLCHEVACLPVALVVLEPMHCTKPVFVTHEGHRASKGLNVPGWVQIGMLLHEALLAHMLRFRYSDYGALQLKRDVSEYQQCMHTFGIARVNELFEQLMQLADMLIVPPTSLPHVLEARGLQMDRATVRKYIALREDYATARVGGKPLSLVLGDPAALAAASGSGSGSGSAPATGAKGMAASAASRARGWMGGGGLGGGT